MNVAEIIRKRCPDLTLESIEPLGEGDFCRAFLINQNLVFRFAKHDEARRSLMRENCLLPKIAANISIRIPQPTLLSSVEKAEESFVVYDFLPEQSLSTEKYLRLATEKRAECAGAAARFLNDFHAIDPEIATLCGVPRLDYSEKYENLLIRIQSDFRGRFEPEFYDFAVEQIEDFLRPPLFHRSPEVLLHGDLSPDHVLFDGENVTAIIDFGDMMIGEAAWDFLWLYEDYGTDFFVRALAKYNVSDKREFAGRVLRFSNLEAIQWVVDCFESGDDNVDEALENLRDRSESPDAVKTIFDNLPEN